MLWPLSIFDSRHDGRLYKKTMKPQKKKAHKGLRKKEVQNKIQTLQITCWHAGAHMK